MFNSIYSNNYAHCLHIFRYTYIWFICFNIFALLMNEINEIILHYVPAEPKYNFSPLSIEARLFYY